MYSLPRMDAVVRVLRNCIPIMPRRSIAGFHRQAGRRWRVSLRTAREVDFGTYLASIVLRIGVEVGVG